jgi:hypothetical protein
MPTAARMSASNAKAPIKPAAKRGMASVFA